MPESRFCIIGLIMSGLICRRRPDGADSACAAGPASRAGIEHREVRHGATVVDNYFWLREKSNPEVIQYLEAENAYTEAMTRT